MALYRNININEKFLNETPNAIFVFGDNLERKGNAGAAILRNHSRSYGFITKKFPSNFDNSFYTPSEYSSVFFEELKKLEEKVKFNRKNVFYISKLGAGLANKFRIWELLIQHNLTLALEKYNNVVFCWDGSLN